jgi:hypothetical protein
VQCEANGHCCPGIQVQADQGESIVDHEQLHQQRRTLEQGDVGDSHAFGDEGAGRSRKCDGKARDAAANKANRRQRHCPLQAFQKKQELAGAHGLLPT